jgi:hypothetical protein
MHTGYTFKVSDFIQKLFNINILPYMQVAKDTLQNAPLCECTLDKKMSKEIKTLSF